MDDEEERLKALKENLRIEATEETFAQFAKHRTREIIMILAIILVIFLALV